MATNTYTSTYTVADIRRVLGSFAADLAMMVQSSGVTGAWTRSRLENLVADLVDFANAGYLAEVHVGLWNDGREIRAARYTPSTSAYGWINERPGGAIWPRTGTATIEVV